MKYNITMLFNGGRPKWLLQLSVPVPERILVHCQFHVLFQEPTSDYLDGVKQHLQNDLDKLVKWSEKWQMLFNFGKRKCLHTEHGNLDVNHKMGDTILGVTVKEKTEVTIGADMKVSEQCVIAASKGNQILGLIRRNIAYKEKS